MARRRKRGRTKTLAATVLLLAGLAAAAYLYLEQAKPAPKPGVVRLPPGGTMRVHYVDVGQGDGTVWEFPDGTLVVYDCGDVASSADDNPMVRHLRDVMGRAPGSVIHAFVSSHGHRDHVGGCDEVFETYRILHVYEGWYDGADRPRSYDRFRNLTLAEGARLHTLRETAATDREEVFRRWDPLDLPLTTNATARFFWPDGMDAGDWDDVAGSSLGVQLRFGDVTFCFQGDVETGHEMRLAAEAPQQDLACDVYLVGHHGSREASSAAWLRRMSPAVAVVSFGENPYGHPTSEALCRVQGVGAKVYATHRAGTVVVETDGRDVRVSPDAPETKDYCAAGASYWT